MGAVPRSVSVLVADSDDVYCEFIERHALREAGWSFVGSTNGGREAARLVELVRPAVLILGQTFADEEAPGLIGEVRRRSPGTAVMIAAGHVRHALIAKALAEGALGYFLKTLPWPDLAALIRSAAAGEIALGPLTAMELARGEQEPTETGGLAKGQMPPRS